MERTKNSERATSGSDFSGWQRIACRVETLMAFGRAATVHLHTILKALILTGELYRYGESFHQMEVGKLWSFPCQKV
jgi:hypothetical protein